jgi:hypothetical protein
MDAHNPFCFERSLNAAENGRGNGCAQPILLRKIAERGEKQTRRQRRLFFGQSE